VPDTSIEDVPEAASETTAIFPVYRNFATGVKVIGTIAEVPAATTPENDPVNPGGRLIEVTVKFPLPLFAITNELLTGLLMTFVPKSKTPLNAIVLVLPIPVPDAGIVIVPRVALDTTVTIPS
jgi:hypothetical protein